MDQEWSKESTTTKRTHPWLPNPQFPSSWLAAVHSRHTTQLDYVLAYPQAPVEYEIYMETPKRFDLTEETQSKTDYVIKQHYW